MESELKPTNKIKSLRGSEEVKINIFFDDFSSGNLSKWTSTSPLDTTQVVEYDGGNALCVAGMGNATYLHTNTDGHYNLDTHAFLNLTFQFLMENKESSPNIYIKGPHGGRSFTIKCDNFNLEPNVWYDLNVTAHCPPNSDPELIYRTRLMGNATSGSTDKTYFKNISINQVYLLDTTFKEDSWVEDFVLNDDLAYKINEGLLTISTDTLPTSNETPTVLLNSRKGFIFSPYTINGIMRSFVTLSGAGENSDGSEMSLTVSLKSETMDFHKKTSITDDINIFQDISYLIIVPDTYFYSVSANNMNESNSGGEFKIKRIVIGSEYLNISKL